MHRRLGAATLVVYALLTWLRYTMSYYSLWFCLRQTTDSKGYLVDLLLDFVGSQNYHRYFPPAASSVGRTLIRHCSTALFFLCAP